MLLLSCAVSEPRPRPVPQGASGSKGEAEAPPALSALPDPVRGEPMDSERMHQGFTMARQVFAGLMPEPPADRSYTSLQAWVEQQVAPWVEKRRDGVDDTRFQFALTASSHPADVVVAHAVLALLHEDTAAELSNIPSPAELANEPEVSEMFRELVSGQALPFVSAARDEYRLCANAGYQEGADLRRWAEFCKARFDRLAPPPAKPTPAPSPQPTAASAKAP